MHHDQGDQMRKSWIICTVLLSLSSAGCVSLRSTAFAKIHEGDSEAHVIEVLGQPDSFRPSQRISGASAWYYVRRGEICGVTIESSTVRYLACEVNPNYRNPAGVFLQTFGDSMQNANKNSTTCTTNGNSYGGSYNGTTTCR